MPSFSGEEVLQATGGKWPFPAPSVRFRRVGTDSRSVHAGDLFVALKGEKFDGHRFIEEALTRGALGTIVEPRGKRKALAAIRRITRFDRTRNPVVLEVRDSLRAYQDLATYHRRKFQIPVVAVTGSNGKTTTKDMVGHVLIERWKTLTTKGNFNNCIGVPQTLFHLTSRHKVAVIEMGVDQEGQTRRLCEIANPTIGVITNIGPDHLEHFGSLQTSARAKAELLSCLPNDGMIVLNADDEFFPYLKRKASCQILSYGFSPKADVRASDMVSNSHGTVFRLSLPSRRRSPKIVLPVHGHHNVSNALAGAAVGHGLGLRSGEIAKGLAHFSPAHMRSQIRRWKGITFLYDCYNANPASMKAAVNLASELGRGKRTIAVLGEMRELGKEERRFHQDIGGYVARQKLTHLLVCGNLGRWMARGARSAGMPASAISETKDVSAAGQRLKGLLQRGDVVLLKASRSVQMEQVLDVLCKS